MTTMEYLLSPETVSPTELAYGELRVAESPTVTHQRVVRDLAFRLADHVERRHAGEVLFAPMDVVLDYPNALIVQPDILYVSTARRQIVTDRVYGAPDLVVEVLSPHPRIGDLNERLGWFCKYGVRECWVAHATERKIAVLRLSEERIESRTVHSGGERVCSGVLDGIEITPAQIFGW
jgi:Uma2 family endonuclease